MSSFATKIHKKSASNQAHSTIQMNAMEEETVQAKEQVSTPHPDTWVSSIASQMNGGAFDGGTASGTLEASNVSNGTATSTIQTKLNIGEPDDKFEKEADETADMVMSKPMAAAPPPASTDDENVQGKFNGIQREEEEEKPKEAAPVNPIEAGSLEAPGGEQSSKFSLETTTVPTPYTSVEEETVATKSFLQTMPEEETQVSTKSFLQTMPEEETQVSTKSFLQTMPEEDKVQTVLYDEDKDLPNDMVNAKFIQTKKKEEPKTKAENKKSLKNLTKDRKKVQLKGEGGAQASSSFESTLSSTKGSGDPLPKNTQSEMESRFGGRDFSNVRIHTDSTSQSMNQEINSRAFTNESDIYFNSGQFDDSSSAGKNLLAHELTHTIQQGASGDVVQAQFNKPEMPQDQTVTEQDTSGDGNDADKNTQDRIHEDVDQDDIDDAMSKPLDKKGAQDRSLSEAQEGQGELVDEGAVDPVHDRPGDQKENVETSKKNIQEGVNEEGEVEEGEEKEEEQPFFNLMEADATRVEIMNYNLMAEAVPFPKEPDPVEPPEMKRGKDEKGDWVPMNPENDMKLFHLANYAQAFREIGYEMQIEAYETEVESYRASASAGEIQERIDTAEAYEIGVGIRIGEWQDYSDGKLRPALHVAEEKTAWTEEEANKLGDKAEDQFDDAESLVGGAEEQSKEVEEETEEEPDAQNESKDIEDSANETEEGATSIFDSFKLAGERADQQVLDAQQAKLDNEETHGKADQIDTDLESGRAILTEMRAQNLASQEQLDAESHTPAEMLKASSKSAESGDELIKATEIVESEIHKTQKEYYSEMATVPSRERAEKENAKDADKDPEEEPDPEAMDLPDFSEEEKLAFQFAAMSEEDQDALLSEMTEDEIAQLQMTFEDLEAQQIAAEEAEKAKAEQDARAGSMAHIDEDTSRVIINLNAEKSSDEEEAEALAKDPRVNYIGVVENNRAMKLQRPLKIINQNYIHISKYDKERLHNKMKWQMYWHKMTSIKMVDVQDMFLEMFSLTSIKEGLLSDVSQILTGYVNLFNVEAWKKDPLGNLLQSGADISEGLTNLFVKGIITAGIVWALCALFIALTWGVAAVSNMPIMIWLKSVMATLGTWAMWTGGFALAFNFLLGLKHTSEAGAAKDSEDTLKAGTQAQSDIDGMMTGLNGIGVGKFAINPSAAIGSMLNTGRSFLLLVTKPGKWATNMIAKVAQTGKALGGMTLNATKLMLKGVKMLYSGGVKGIRSMIKKIKKFFKKRTPGERKISQDLYNKLRKKTPNKRIRDKVNQGKKPPYPDPALPGKKVTGRLEADHIVSMDKISRMKNFNKLTFEQQVQILNFEENFVGLSKSANASKGAKSFAEWTTYIKEGITVNPAFRMKMMQLEVQLEGKIQNMINTMAKSNKF